MSNLKIAIKEVTLYSLKNNNYIAITDIPTQENNANKAIDRIKIAQK